MQEWVIQIIEQFGYLGLFLMMTIENIFPPIPSEIILPFAGFLTTYSTLTVSGVVIAATLGSLIGAMVLYCIGMLLDIERLEKIISRYGKYIRTTEGDLRRGEKWFEKYGVITVFFCRMIPLIRSLISLPAGMARMRFSTFTFLTFFGTFIWNVILITIGFLLAENWTSIVLAMSYYSKITYTILIVFFLFIVYFYLKRSIKQS